MLCVFAYGVLCWCGLCGACLVCCEVWEWFVYAYVCADGVELVIMFGEVFDYVVCCVAFAGEQVIAEHVSSRGKQNCG